MVDDSTPHDDDLESLARRRFGKLSEAEKRLVRAVPKGEPAMCGPNSDREDPANDPANADDWGKGREIRAELIRWLCVDPGPSRRVDPRGIVVGAAKITGSLDLSFAIVPFPLGLTRCRLVDDADFSHVKIPALDLDSATRSISAEYAEVEGSVAFNEGFSAVGEVSLLGARIGNDLDCRGGIFTNRGNDALSLDRAEIKGIVFLSDGFSAEGAVRLPGAQIGDDLECSHGTFKNRGGMALGADGAEIKGSVNFTDGFSAAGDVRLFGAQIGGNLECEGGTFSALLLYETTVRGRFSWHDVGDARSTVLFLTAASVGTIVDDEGSWPGKDKLALDGFVYGRISGPTDARTRLDWLDRQKLFTPQPYRQLAKVLREMGDDDGAKQVLFELEKRARAEDRKRLVHSPVRWLIRSSEDVVSDATVGYGIYPGRAIWYLCGLTVLGWIVHRRAQRVGAMAPTDKDAYAEFHKGQTPVLYQPFSPMIYAVENCIPLVKLGQDERWQPDPNPQHRVPPTAKRKFSRIADAVLDFPVRDWAVTPAALRWFRWIMIGLGWLLATFFVAALTGVIKTG